MTRRTEYPFMNEIREDYQQLIKDGKVTCTEKIPFICPIHGEYLQSLNVHKNHGCLKCRNKNSRKTNYPFMEEIREDYRIKIQNGEINCVTKVPFICKEHGEYWQQLNNHSSGNRCPKCKYMKFSKLQRITNYPFMDEIHPDYQQLIKDRKIISKNKVPFICQKHGIYWQSLNAHSNGNKCPKCRCENRKKKTTMNKGIL
jgi:predicted nucleic-acid-binding Zn-ribbon protein